MTYHVTDVSSRTRGGLEKHLNATQKKNATWELLEVLPGVMFTCIWRSPDDDPPARDRARKPRPPKDRVSEEALFIEKDR